MRKRHIFIEKDGEKRAYFWKKYLISNRLFWGGLLDHCNFFPHFAASCYEHLNYEYLNDASQFLSA